MSKYAEKKVVGVGLRLYSCHPSICSASGPGYRCAGSSPTGTHVAISWSAQLLTTSGVVPPTMAKGYNSSCPAGHISWDIDAIVQAWADRAARLRHPAGGVDKTSVPTWRKYRLANHVDSTHDPNAGPSLTVIHDSCPADFTSTAITPSAVNACKEGSI